MKTITRKGMKKLVRLANIACEKAIAHDEAQIGFCQAFEEITGEQFDGMSMNGDPIVDIIDYGNDVAKQETFVTILNDYLEGVHKTAGVDYLIE